MCFNRWISKRNIITDKGVYNKVLEDALNNRNEIIDELKIKYDSDINENGVMVPYTTDFLTKMYIKKQIDKNISDSDFINNFFIEIKRRGHNINLITYTDSKVVKKNKKVKKIIDCHIEEIKLSQLKEILDSKLIDRDEYKEFIELQKGGKTMSEENNQIKKYKLYEWYMVKINMDAVVLYNFIYDEANGEQLKLWRINWKRFILEPNSKLIKWNELPIYDSYAIEKFKLLDRLLREIGFDKGFLSHNTIETIDNFKIDENDLAKLRVFYRSSSDIGQSRFNNEDSHNFIKYLNRLLKNFNGCEINFDNIRISENGERHQKKSNYRLVILQKVKEFLILDNYKYCELLNISKEDSFNYHHIHGINGTYGEYVNDKSKREKYKFIDTSNQNESIISNGLAAREIVDDFDYAIDII